MKIVLHGFGAYPIVFRHLIAAARARAPHIGWAVILPTPHHRDLMRQVLGEDDILSLSDHQSRDLKPLSDASALSNYRGNIFATIEAEKRAFKHRPAWQQLARAAEIYQIYKAFLQRTAPTHLLIPQIEGLEGRMLPDLAVELGIMPLVPTNGRTLGGTFFSVDAQETLPAYRQATAATLDAARAFLARFRREGGSASGLPERIDPDDERLDDFKTPLHVRAAASLRRNLQRPDLFEFEYLRASLLTNLPWLRDSAWRLFYGGASKDFDIGELAQLPSRFVYYPLQMTPESSINTPAPFFVDQTRAIDAIRFAMPNDHMLVVKEHPAAIATSTRPRSFMRALRRRAGVTVVDYRTDSRALIERAALTVSVTGTSTLEAFLLGRPAVTLGPSLIAGYIGGVAPLDSLATRIKDAIGFPPGRRRDRARGRGDFQRQLRLHSAHTGTAGRAHAAPAQHRPVPVRHSRSCGAPS